MTLMGSIKARQGVRVCVCVSMCDTKKCVILSK